LLETGGHAGDEGNFEALYRTYKSEVQRLASYLLRNRADAEDASQTVFLNVLRAMRQGANPTEPRAWLLAITRNVCFSRRRAVACRPDEVELDYETASERDELGPTADEIVGALARMRPNQRTALILRDFRGASRAEISRLLSMSTTGVEALLTRARASFRDELEAGDQPFDCAETKALVEQQLEGHISVAERHSLRTHLRHCSPCSTLARAVRSSRGKLAGLVLWPAGLVSRLAAAFSQASTAVHVAAAISSTAAVATVAIPVAMNQAQATPHVASGSPPARAVVSHPGTSSGSPAVVVSRPTSRSAAAAHEASHHARHRARIRSTHGSAPTMASATAGASVPTQHVSPPAAAPAPSVTQPVAVPPRSSPAVRPGGKAKPKPSRRRPVRGRGPLPIDRAPISTPPADSLLPGDNGAVDGAGPGISLGTTTTPSLQGSSGGSGSGSSPGSSSTDGSSAAGASSGHGHHGHKH